MTDERVIAQYRISGVLGQGGMGVVYEATDTRLLRPVALKLLSPALTGHASSRKRFLIEARSASALDHPNICTIHEIGETPEGEVFLVMALYRGRTVAERLLDGPLPWPEALGIARQVLLGLAAARQARVVHRDIKPSNLMVTDQGLVKILDFGLAKLLDLQDDSPTRSQVTHPGVVVGTARYMSPEQGRGHQVDHRTDLWATGVVLYEMVTGHLPFRGGDAISTMFAICTEPHPPVLHLRPDLPPAIEAVLARALAKRPEDRYPGADEFRRDLEALGSSAAGLAPFVAPPPPPLTVPTPSGVSERAILILPFANLPPDPGTEYFSDGLTDEVIADLSVVRSLRVISRTSAMRLKGTTKDIKTLGREVNVRYVLEGTVSRAAGDLRVVVKLVDTLTDFPLWAEKYRGTLANVFDIQERISRSIVDVLRVKLTSEEDARIGKRPITDLQAYECYLRARQEILKFSGDALDRALEYLGQAAALLGENAAVLAATGFVHWQYLNAGISSDPGHLERGKACAERALHLDPDSPHAHQLLGLIAVRAGDIQTAVDLLKRALARDASDVDSLFWLAVLYGFAGRAAAAQPLVERLLGIDPLTPFHHALPGLVAAMGGDLAAAAEPFARAARMEPGNPVLRHFHGHLLAMGGKHEQAFEVWDRLARDLPDTFFARLGQAEKLALLGDRAGTLRALDRDLQEVARGDLQYSWNLAECHALIGDDGAAVDWLGNAVRLGLLNYPLLAHQDPLLEGARSEPAFTRLMADLKPRWERFEI